MDNLRKPTQYETQLISVYLSWYVGETPTAIENLTSPVIYAALVLTMGVVSGWGVTGGFAGACIIALIVLIRNIIVNSADADARGRNKLLLKKLEAGECRVAECRLKHKGAKYKDALFVLEDGTEVMSYADGIFDHDEVGLYFYVPINKNVEFTHVFKLQYNRDINHSAYPPPSSRKPRPDEEERVLNYLKAENSYVMDVVMVVLLVTFALIFVHKIVFFIFYAEMVIAAICSIHFRRHLSHKSLREAIARVKAGQCAVGTGTFLKDSLKLPDGTVLHNIKTEGKVNQDSKCFYMHLLVDKHVVFRVYPLD